MKKVIALILALIMVLGLTACGGNAGNDASNDASNDADNGKVYEFTFACEDASTAASAEVWNNFIKRVEENSNGRIKITPYYGGVLGASSEQINMVETGAVDLTHAAPGHLPGRFPMTEIFTSPGLKYESSWQIAKALEYLYSNSKYDYLKEETKEIKILGFRSNNRDPFSHIGEPWTSADDIKGVTINASNGPTNAMTSALGMVQVSVAFPDRYEGIQKGTIQACTSDYLALESFSMYDVVNSVLDTSYACQCGYLAMNLDSWNSLPEDLQAVMEEAGSYMADEFYSVFKEVENRAYDLAKEKNVTIYEPNDEVKAALDEAYAAGAAEWIRMRTEEGYDAQGFWDEVQAALDMFADKIPEV